MSTTNRCGNRTIVYPRREPTATLRQKIVAGRDGFPKSSFSICFLICTMAAVRSVVRKQLGSIRAMKAVSEKNLVSSVYFELC